MTSNKRPSPAPSSTEIPPATLGAEEVFGEQLLTTDQVAKMFGTAEATIREWINHDELPAVKWGKRYYISVSGLRQAKEAKEQERHRATELARRQKREPLLYWELTYCLACGTEPVLATRHMRLDGDVRCPTCSGQTQADTKPALTKDGWERKVALFVYERNKQAEPDAVPAWGIYRCYRCGKPQPLHRNSLANSSFYPWCDHALPFGPRWDSPAEAEGKPDPNVVEHFGNFALQALSGVEPDAMWAKCQCSRCGESEALASLEDRLIGFTRCRLCPDDSIVNSLYQAQIVLAALAELTPESRTYDQRACACQRREVIDRSADQVVLSWCTERGSAERNRLAQAYAEKHSLSERTAQNLRIGVLYPRSAPSDPNDTPF